MKRIKHIFLFIIVCGSFLAVNAQIPTVTNGVGIKTESPTRELDVNGSMRIRSIGNTQNVPEPVAVLPNGTLITAASSEGAPGVRFLGILQNDVSTIDRELVDFAIPSAGEEIDLLDEYSVDSDGNGRYVPKSSGFYKIFMDFDIGDYTDPSRHVDIIIGLADYDNMVTITDNGVERQSPAWVARRVFRHRNDNNTDNSNALNTSYSTATYVNLTAGTSYGFRAFATHNRSVPRAQRTTKIVARNRGSQDGVSSFLIQKIR